MSHETHARMGAVRSAPLREATTEFNVGQLSSRAVTRGPCLKWLKSLDAAQLMQIKTMERDAHPCSAHSAVSAAGSQRKCVCKPRPPAPGRAGGGRISVIELLENLYTRVTLRTRAARTEARQNR